MSPAPAWASAMEAIFEKSAPPHGGLARFWWRAQKSWAKRRLARQLKNAGEAPIAFTSPVGFKFMAFPGGMMDRAVLREGAWEPATARHFPRLIYPGDTVLDVGANIGLFSILFSNLAGPGGSVHAFEPMAGAFERMKALHALNTPGFCHNNTTLHQMGLSNEEGEMEVAFEHAFSADMKDRQQTTAERVFITTLDAFVEKENLTRLDFLKVDVDGWDTRVVRGGLKTLARFRPRLMAEFCFNENPETAELFALLKELEYRFFWPHDQREISQFSDLENLLAGKSWRATNLIGLPSGDGPLAEI